MLGDASFHWINVANHVAHRHLLGVFLPSRGTSGNFISNGLCIARISGTWDVLATSDALRFSQLERQYTGQQVIPCASTFHAACRAMVRPFVLISAEFYMSVP